MRGDVRPILPGVFLDVDGLLTGLDHDGRTHEPAHQHQRTDQSHKGRVALRQHGEAVRPMGERGERLAADIVLPQPIRFVSKLLLFEVEDLHGEGPAFIHGPVV